MPIHFIIDDEETVHDPKGLKGNKLSVKLVVSTTPKERLYKILEDSKTSAPAKPGSIAAKANMVRDYRRDNGLRPMVCLSYLLINF